MARGIVDAGRAVQQQLEPQRRIDPPVQSNQWRAPQITQTNNPPPLPEYLRPMNTPVMDMKRETANNWDFTPEAREMLYDTPTLVNYRGYDNKPEDEPAGYYRPPSFNYDAPEVQGNHQIMVNETEGNRPFQKYGPGGGETTWPSLGSGVLAHEFGHKWDFEQVPDYLREEWGRGDWMNSPVWTDSFRQKMAANPPTAADNGLFRGETYANTVMGSNVAGTEMPPEYRDKYFAGLFNYGAQEWQPAPEYAGPQYPATFDVFPRQWSPPQFPALYMYGEAQG